MLWNDKKIGPNTGLTVLSLKQGDIGKFISECDFLVID